MEIYTVDQAFDILKGYGVLSNVQVLRRWIREGRIDAEMEKRQSGYEIPFSEIDRILQNESVLYWKEKALNLEKELKELKSNVTQNVPRETFSNITNGNKYFKKDLEKLNRDEIRSLCRYNNVKYGNLTKAQMIEKLTLL